MQKLKTEKIKRNNQTYYRTIPEYRDSLLDGGIMNDSIIFGTAAVIIMILIEHAAVMDFVKVVISYVI